MTLLRARFWPRTTGQAPSRADAAAFACRLGVWLDGLAYAARISGREMLTQRLLNAGIAAWRSTKWPQDFHEAFYKQRAGEPTLEEFDAAWIALSPHLRRWRATRPLSTSELSRRAKFLGKSLSAIWKDSVAPLKGFDISEVEWSRVSAFPDLVAEIKNVSSPVFTSKFCHFVAPRIFPVVDNAAMRNPFRVYADYYQCVRSAWLHTSATDQDELLDIMTRAIQSGRKNANRNPVSSIYPFKCKIAELCLVGKHAMST